MDWIPLTDNQCSMRDGRIACVWLGPRQLRHRVQWTWRRTLAAQAVRARSWILYVCKSQFLNRKGASSKILGGSYNLPPGVTLLLPDSGEQEPSIFPGSGGPSLHPLETRVRGVSDLPRGCRGSSRRARKRRLRRENGHALMVIPEELQHGSSLSIGCRLG